MVICLVAALDKVEGARAVGGAACEAVPKRSWAGLDPVPSGR